MEEIERIENSDEGLRDPSIADAPLKKGKIKTRHKVTRGSKRRPRSANVRTTAANSSSSNRPGVDAKLRDENTERQRQQREGLGTRGDGPRISRNVNSVSAPQLLMRNTTPGTAGDKKRGDENTTGSVHEEGGGRRLFGRRRTPSAVNNVDGVADLGVEEEGELEKVQQSIKYTTRSLQELGLQKQEIELRHRQMENRCTQLEVELSSKQSELKSYKAEVRAKIIAVGKAEMILNDVCIAMARRVGRAEGTQMSDNKGAILMEVHGNPAEFASQIKKKIVAQLSKWDIDRVDLEASAEHAREKATDAIQVVHEAECANLSARTELLEEKIRQMEIDSQRVVAEAESAAKDSHDKAIAASAAERKLTQELEAAAARNNELCQTAKDKEKEFQAQLDRFMEYPKAAERMAEELEKCEKTARREKNLMVLERKEFRRQLHMFQKWQTENSNLREKARAQEMQVVALRRQLAVIESGLAGSASTRKAVIGGTVDRLQRAETAAKHQAHKYRELAGARGVQAAQMKTEISSLKATIKTLRLKLEPPAHDSYETEIARLARVNPEVLDIQQKSGLSKEDMEASMAQLKLLREKVRSK
ncbi:unnamed protein product, partial [Ectocarpus sp. 12 AP-2014]